MRQSIRDFILIGSILSVMYSPALFIQYAHHDSAAFFDRMPGKFEKHSLHDIDFALGRFVAAYLETGIGLLVDSISDLNVLSFLSLLMISLCGYFIFLRLERILRNRMAAFFSTIILLSLPSFEIIVVYASIVYFTPAIVCSFYAAEAVDKIPIGSNDRTKMFFGNFAISTVLLVCALSIHQSMAMVYWGTAALILWESSQKDFGTFCKKAFNLFFAGFFAMGTYAVILQLVKSRFIARTWGEYNPYVINLDFLNKFKWFFEEPVFNTLNLWNLFPEKRLPVMILLFVVSACAMVFFRNVFDKTSGERTPVRLAKCLLIGSLFFLLLPLSFLPNMLANGHVAWYRCCIALTLVIGVILLWALIQWTSLLPVGIGKKVFVAILFLASLWGVSKAFDNVLRYVVFPNHLEIEYIKQIVDQTDTRSYQHIHIIRPSLSWMNARYDEFGILSTYYAGGISSLLKCIYRELGKEGKLYEPDVTFSSGLPEEQIRFSNRTLVIDMNRLRNLILSYQAK